MASYDTDPDALAWARNHIQQYLDRLADFEQQAHAKSDLITEMACAAAQAMTQKHFLGDGLRTIGVFEQRPTPFEQTPGSPS